MNAVPRERAGSLQERGLRRLPVYAVLDASASMAGAPLAAAREGVHRLVNYLVAHDAPAHTPIVLGLIGFQSCAFPLLPLTSASALADVPLELERLEACGSSSFGAALEVLDASIEGELTSPGSATGDERPLVYIFTDGRMTDDWSYRREVLQRTTTLVCGDSPEILRPQGGFRRAAHDVVKQFLSLEAWDDMCIFVDGALERMRRVPPRTIPWPTTY